MQNLKLLDGQVKGRVWSKIMFCVWLAFAVKIVVAMTAELNLACMVHVIAASKARQ